MSTDVTAVPIIKPALFAGIVATAVSYFAGHKADLLPTFGVMAASSLVANWINNATCFMSFDAVEDKRLIPGAAAGLVFAGVQHFRKEGSFGMNFGIGAVSGIVGNYWAIDKDEAIAACEAKKKE